MVITSTKNETIKLIRRLKERSFRRQTGLHLIEGERLVFDALASGAVPDTVLVEDGKTDLASRLDEMGVGFITVNRAVIEATADTPSPQGIIASIRTPDADMPEELCEGLYVALDALQDPGNLGTVIRTADAMGARGIILGRGCTDAFSPKALRSAMGSTYHLPVYEAELSLLIPKLTAEGFIAVCGHLRGEEKFPNPGRKCIIVIGNEGSGVSDEAAEKCILCRLPMYGRAESLNASVAASILIFEMARQMAEADKITV